jgi:acyl transferase domain-containing protein/NAD(P)H-dependent flavin oxidoreductase YrpB (nitropropane dioxygenase family)
MAFSPSGFSEPGFVVGACRAGALGVLDFELGFSWKRAVGAAHDVARFTDRPFGLRLPWGALNQLNREGLPDALTAVIAVHGAQVPACSDWNDCVRAANRGSLLLLAEVGSRAAADEALSAGVFGVIVAGHEAGGRIGEESSFVLLQGVLAQPGRRVWVRGGIGPRAAAACIAAGAAGVVLDGALLLARESPLPSSIRGRLKHWDGSETAVYGIAAGAPHRLHAAPALALGSNLREAESGGRAAWEAAISRLAGWRADQAWPAGQDAAFAAPLAERYATVGGIVQAVEHAIEDAPRLAHQAQSLAEGSPLARAHRTRFPIVQGPMTRVSDTPAFAEAVANAGGLPFLALALSRGPDVRALLADTARRLEGTSWGVGILGFVPPELRLEQVAAIRAARPPFALIAGGRPDQARELEREHITTYLHVPSPALLQQYLKEGSRRFVLEGRECGGHVGPRSSFVLWEQALATLEQAIEQGTNASEIYLLFAGGIHDARSAAILATMSAQAAVYGVNIGVLLGTAYLFTKEAVDTGAIVAGFQQEAVQCAKTVLLETGPGHEVRVCPSPFTESFAQERARLIAGGRPHAEVRAALEDMNVGRLRIAAKGVDRSQGSGSALVGVPRADQRSRGLYMLGQVAALRKTVTTIESLHREIADGHLQYLAPGAAAEEPRIDSRPSDIAIVGMAAVFPGATDARTFWRNTLAGFDAITEVPAERWDWRLYYDPDPKAPDKITSKWGGFLPEIPFDPLRYGMPPTSLSSIEPMHLLTLEVVRAALDDAGYRERPFPRERTSVVLGAGGGAAQMAMGYAFRSYLPLLDTVIPGGGRDALARCGAVLPEWTEDSFPGILLNVAAGRVANRFDLGGSNYTVDAACGSSLAAASLAVRELETGAADMVILGGADTVQNPFTYLAFSKTHAFSPRGRCRPFDASADGIVISEGVAALVLKRLADAERDGDRIYALIKGMGASSDGRAKGLTAPRPEGQVRALERAYAKAGVSPSTVGYVEAHGTGTPAGDLSEVQALTEVWCKAKAAPAACALGSVKSSIGHTKCAAGLAGLINASLALYHKMLPPTIGVETPNPRAGLAGSPFHLSTAARPWVSAGSHEPRRAGVSAFGFGGTNFHAVLEEYVGDPIAPPDPVRDWPAELFVWRAGERSTLVGELDHLAAALERGVRPALRDLAYTLQHRAEAPQAGKCLSLAIVARSTSDLTEKLARARRLITSGATQNHDPRGISYAERPAWAGAKLAVVFPGQGAQYPSMLRELATFFPEVREAFDRFDHVLRTRGRPVVGPLVFPPPAFSDAEREAQRALLQQPQTAQPAVGAACVGLLHLLRNLGVDPDLLAGHSYGELVALHAAGCFSEAALAELSEARGRLLVEAAGENAGAMAALAAGPAQTSAVLDGLPDVHAVNWNGPAQTVISGPRAAVERAVERAQSLRIRAQILPVACAFHSPLVAGAREPLAALVRSFEPGDPEKAVYSNASADRYPASAREMHELLGEHVARPVRFAEMVEAMYAAGARVFLDAGPGGVVSALIGSILAGKPHLTLACDHPARGGLVTFLEALGRLFAAGVPLRLDRLTTRRAPVRLDPERFEPIDAIEQITPSTWFVDGARARPANASDVPVFGRGAPLPVDPAAKTEQRRDFAPTSGPNTAPASVPAALPGSDRAIEAFQATMQKFLDVQRTTMLGYLAARNGPSASPHADTLSSPASATPSAPAVLPHAQTPPEPSQNGHGSILENRNGAPHAVNLDRNGRTVERDDLASHLMRIVQERTGYPPEMLKLDLDLEADLGIDSIKRVEILGSLRDSLPESAFGHDSDAMDQLSRARTLGAIVDRLGKHFERTTALKENPSTRAIGRPIGSPTGNGILHHEAHTNGAPKHHAAEGQEVVERFILHAVDAPLPAARAGLARGGVVLLTDDGRGIARAVAADLRALGHPVVRVHHGVTSGDVEGLNLSSPEAVAALIERVRARGPLAGILHALPLRAQSTAGLDPEAWQARVGVELRGLYLLARAAAEDLRRASAHGGACLIAATAMGGAYASVEAAPAEFFPGHGGIAGLLKTLAREWPQVRVRSVDFAARDDAEVIAANLVQEVLADERRSEVGYLRSRRIALAHAIAPLSQSVSPGDGVELRADEPLLVTGGARGITAEVVADFAERWRPTLLLVGSSPRPASEENPETLGVTAPTELKSILLARLKREGKGAAPAEVEQLYRALRSEREIRSNLRRFESLGARVEYGQADVRDAQALAQLLAAWEARFGPPRGLIHGAGVIQDKLICDKVPESFDHVLGTKVDGALALARLVKPEQLRFAAFFSSVAGRFGNRGQGDYAAAIEALNKLAIWLDERWPCRVVSFMWGPWSTIGMVSDLEAHLGRRGLGMIPPAVGRMRVAEELKHGPKGTVEVIVAGALGSLADPVGEPVQQEVC